MGTIAQEILRKAHGIEQRTQIKNEVDSAEANLKNKDKGAKDKTDDKELKAEKDKRDLGDSPADAKATGQDAEKGKAL